MVDYGQNNRLYSAETDNWGRPNHLRPIPGPDRCLPMPHSGRHYPRAFPIGFSSREHVLRRYSLWIETKGGGNCK